jgi:hypothetical protein
VSAWKDAERWFCAMLGTRRRGQVSGSGWAAGSDDDGSCPWAVEVKHVRRPQLKAIWLEQAQANAKATEREYLLINAVRGKNRMDAPTTVRFGEFLAVAAAAGRLGPDSPFLASIGSAPLSALPLEESISTSTFGES